MLIVEMLKKEVIDSNANKLGAFTDAEFDLNTGILKHYVLKTGMFSKEIYITPDKIDKIGQKIILKVSKADLQNLSAVAK